MELRLAECSLLWLVCRRLFATAIQSLLPPSAPTSHLSSGEMTVQWLVFFYPASRSGLLSLTPFRVHLLVFSNFLAHFIQLFFCPFSSPPSSFLIPIPFSGLLFLSFNTASIFVFSPGSYLLFPSLSLTALMLLVSPPCCFCIPKHIFHCIMLLHPNCIYTPAPSPAPHSPWCWALLPVLTVLVSF